MGGIMFRIEHNVKTGEIKQIKLTEEEIIEVNNLAKEVEKRQKIQDKKLEEEQAKAEAKAAQRQVILSRLGITEEEARILLGGN
jgi:uncharacterized protein (DUF305 family)